MFTKLLGVAIWISDTMEILQPSLVVIMALSCVVMIVAILASPPESGQGSNVITGATESFYTKNRGKNNQGRLRNVIIICAVIIAACAILYFLSYGIAHS